MYKKILFFALGLIVLAGLGGAAGIYWLVVLNPGEEIKESSIEQILAMESPVYYQDGQHKVGVFFHDAHRQYVPYEEIPQDFLNAIVAAEDREFFEHHGVDYMGILRALIANIKAGRVVQGGSTLTQQAAKNLFKRKDRSLASKLKELLYAWRLEYHYSKEKILEFYANQFYVSGNGRGLGVAARYYFNKAPAELDTLESAFIAGSVKSPGYFNPFIKRTQEGVKRAKELARQRTKYVLRQMYRQGKIDPQTYQRCLGKEIPFEQGRMQYSLNTIMDLVKEALNEPAALEAFSEHGIDNIATSGIRVFTTVEKDLQEQAEHALKKELSRLDVRLLGYDREALQKKYQDLAESNGRDFREGAFLFGRILAVDAEAPGVQVSFDLQGESEEVEGRIDQPGLLNLLESLVKFEKQRWTEASEKDFPDLLGRLQPGDLVYVHLREVEPETGLFLLDLEKYPEIQGGILAVKDGTIRAMVGGHENRFYNRAVTAKRPMGSAIKPLLYSAALQLGWNSADILKNERDMFIYQKEAYFPRPDHVSPYRGVSISWAGVHSENVASVWLLYHLCDKLSPAQFKEVVARLDLARRADESYRQYGRRIRDTYGVVVDQDVLYRTALDKAVRSIEPDIIFDGRLDEYQELQTFHYRAELKETEEEDDGKSAKEKELRQALLEKNYQRFQALRQELTKLREELATGAEGPYLTNLFYNRLTKEFAYGSEPPGEGWGRINRKELHYYLEDRSETARELFWDDILLEGVLSVSTIDLVTESLEKEYQRLAALPAYGEDVLHQTREFRVLVALRYLIGLSRKLGVESRLDPVLSFPLGSNVISLLELARLYQGLVTGQSYSYEIEQEGDGFAVIDRIENSDGEVIFAPERKAKRVVSSQVCIAVSDILRNVVEYGTGRYASRNVRLQSPEPEVQKQLQEMGLGLPVLGKTGTANRFTNATFAGYVPGREEQGNGVVLDDGYVLTSYVGFDDNTPMVRNSTHISGASGALPVWTRLANAILQKKNYAAGLDLIDFYFSGNKQMPLRYPDLGQLEVKVNIHQGGAPAETVADGRDAATIVTFGRMLNNGRFQPARFFKPYWRVTERES